MNFTRPMLLAALAMFVLVFGFLAAVVAGVAAWLVGPRRPAAVVVPSLTTFAALVIGLNGPLGSGLLAWLAVGGIVAFGTAIAKRIILRLLGRTGIRGSRGAPGV